MESDPDLKEFVLEEVLERSIENNRLALWGHFGSDLLHKAVVVLKPQLPKHVALE